MKGQISDIIRTKTCHDRADHMGILSLFKNFSFQKLYFRIVLAEFT